MFKHLLVPLDGSRLAETVVPMAAFLASHLAARVTLVHFVERNAPPQVHGERHLTDADEAQTYLDEVAGREFPPGVPVERHVHTAEISDVPRSIVAHEVELGIDLVVMCTHGRSGLQTRLFGSIVQQVISLGNIPVLLARPVAEAVAVTTHCRRLLAPLDGQLDHEQGLVVATALTKAFASELHLLVVVPTLGTLAGESAATARLLPGVTSALLDLQEDTARDYLAGHAARLRAEGLPVHMAVERGAPARTIVQFAQRVDADIVVLGTHGRGHMEAFWSGSVTPEFIGLSNLPLLLVPVHEAAAPSGAGSQ